MAIVRKVKPGPWHGYDFGGKRLEMAEGVECVMSDRRAEMLLRDYPGGFEMVGATGSEDGAAASGDSGESAPAVPHPAPVPLPPADPALDNLQPAPIVPRATKRRRSSR